MLLQIHAAQIREQSNREVVGERKKGKKPKPAKVVDEEFKTELEESIRSIEEKMIELVRELDELPRIVEQYTIAKTTASSRSQTYYGSVSDRFFFPFWGVYIGGFYGVGVAVTANNNNNNNNNNGSGASSSAGGGASGSGNNNNNSNKKAPATTAAIRSIKAVEKSLFKVNTRLRALPKQLATKNTKIPGYKAPDTTAAPSGNNNNNNGNSNGNNNGGNNNNNNG